MNRLRIFNKAGDPPAPQNKHWYSLNANGELNIWRMPVR